MQLSIHVILDELHLQWEGKIPENNAPSFSWVRLYNRSDSLPDPGYLYVCLYSEYMEYRLNTGKHSNTCFLCLRDRMTSQTDDDAESGRLFLVNEAISLAELFNHVQNVFLRIQDWLEQMDRSVIEQRGIQDLLDLSEDITKNHISVMDQTFRLIAHSRKTPCDDPCVIDFVRLGYHPDEMIEKLRKYKHISYYKSSNEILVDTSYKISKYVGLEKAFSYNGSFGIQVIMNCNIKEYCRSVYELFEIVIHYIAYYVEDSDADISSAASCSSFLYDLVNDHVIKEDPLLRKRADRLLLPAKGCFNAYAITFINDENIPLDRMSKNLTQTLEPYARTIIYKKHVLILNIFNEQDADAQNQKQLDKIKSFLQQYGAVCGISSFFESLFSFYCATQQAVTALETALAKEPESAGLLSPFVFYEDILPQHMLRLYYRENRELLQLTSAYRFVCRLRENDEAHGLHTADILRTWLRCSENAARTAEYLHMHRNNVIYHINRLKEQTGGRFDSPEYKMLLSLCLDLTKADAEIP